MPCRQIEPLRPLTPLESAQLARVSRSQSEPAAQVAYAKALLAVAGGRRFTEAARAAGRRGGGAAMRWRNWWPASTGWGWPLSSRAMAEASRNAGALAGWRTPHLAMTTVGT